MNNKDICEALYALPGGVVEARRRPVFKPAAVALAGAVLLITDIVAVDSSSSGNLSAGLLLVGSILFLAGAIAVALRLCGSSRTPYYVTDGTYLRRRERYYDREHAAALRRAVEACDTAAIDKIPESNVSAVTLVEYYSSKSGLRAFCLYEYAEFELRAVGEVHIVGAGGTRS